MTLPEPQEALAQALMSSARVLRDRGLPDRIEGYPLGDLVFRGRRWEVRYVPGYGVVSGFCTSNGSAREIARCLPDDARWEPAVPQEEL